MTTLPREKKHDCVNKFSATSSECVCLVQRERERAGLTKMVSASSIDVSQRVIWSRTSTIRAKTHKIALVEKEYLPPV